MLNANLICKMGISKFCVIKSKPSAFQSASDHKDVKFELLSLNRYLSKLFFSGKGRRDEKCADDVSVMFPRWLGASFNSPALCQNQGCSFLVPT